MGNCTSAVKAITKKRRHAKRKKEQLNIMENQITECFSDLEDIQKWRQIGIDALARNCSIKISNIFNVMVMTDEFNDKLKNQKDSKIYNPLVVYFAIFQMPEKDNSSTNIGQFLLNLRNYINNNYKTKTMESSGSPPPYRSVNNLYPSLEPTAYAPSVEPSAPTMVV